MKRRAVSILALGAVLSQSAGALTKEELQQRFRQLPSVPEAEMPELKNERTSFPGVVEHPGLIGYTWVTYPFVENPGSFGIDDQGGVYVAETHRFWMGVPDLRGKNELIRGDFQSVTVEDRAKLYQEHAAGFPEGWFTANAERIVRLEDRDGNGAADHRTVFADGFNDPLDGIGFSVLPHEGSVYFTNIPKVWKLTDTDGDGVAEEREAIAEGFGVRVSFLGHDLHGIIVGPDGRLYFSVGDRGYHVTTEDGRVLAESGRGAIFRCEPDGSNFEVYCRGLRNPQELAFDDYGNLFTFDNTGDIGDVARMVYALEGSDSGWDMSHQSPHHYVDALDSGDFHPEKSMWVAEEMFETWNETQPQWVYPPASHVARGPSGVTWLTGTSLPENLRNRFLLANYRGAAENCTVLSVKVESAGAGFTAVSEEEVARGVGVTDVELGYDGRIYLCDWGGGWTTNESGAVRVLEPTDAAQLAAGREVAELFAEGFKNRSGEELRKLLEHPDRRVRQEAQFALVKQGEEGLAALKETANAAQLPTIPRLHAVWGLGQAARSGAEVTELLVSLTVDPDAEIRANVVEVLGDLRSPAGEEAALGLLNDESARVRSLAALALGRIAEAGNEDVIKALFGLVRRNGEGQTDVVIRHSALTALANLESEEAAVSKANSDSVEERLMAVLVLRRLESPELVAFLNDADAQVRREAVRAIYDTAVADTEAGDELAALGPEAADLPATVQRRVVAQNFRRGGEEHARMLLQMAGAPDLAAETRRAALTGLRRWATPPVTDSVHGTYRPVVSAERDMKKLGAAIGADLRDFINREGDPGLISLAMKLADESGVLLDPGTLRTQLTNQKLSPEVRVAALDSLVGSTREAASDAVSGLLESPEPEVRAAAVRHGFGLKLKGIESRGLEAVTGDAPLMVARAAVGGLGQTNPGSLLGLWEAREEKLRRELWLDVFLALQSAADENVTAAAMEWAAGDTTHVFSLSETGGDAARGELIFRNQGACMQCHQINGEGGIQGPPLDDVAARLNNAQILQSLYDPNAVIAEGYGLSSITMKDGAIHAGRIVKEEGQRIHLLALDNTEQELPREQVASISPPVSAMPPLAVSLPPRDLRDLVGYLAVQKKGKGSGKNDGKHGDDEKIAK